MKHFLLSVFVLISSLTYAQSKIEFGLTTEGSLFVPGNSSGYSLPKENGLGLGFGVYASKNLTSKFSADLGLMYRCKQMKEFYIVPDYFVAYIDGVESYVPYGATYGYGSHYDFSNSGKIGGWKNYRLTHLVLPFHLNYNVFTSLFVRVGLEVAWLTNYDAENDRNEYNWSCGVGCQKYKLKWSLDYIRGFNDAGFANDLYSIDRMRSMTAYRNNLLQLNLSYPLWQKK